MTKVSDSSSVYKRWSPVNLKKKESYVGIFFPSLYYELILKFSFFDISTGNFFNSSYLISYKDWRF